MGREPDVAQKRERMPKQTKELTALEVKRLTEAGRHPVGTVPGLYLWGRDTGTKNWLLRTLVIGKRSDIGLDRYQAVSHGDAVKRAREMRKDIAQGGNLWPKRRLTKPR